MPLYGADPRTTYCPGLKPVSTAGGTGLTLFDLYKPDIVLKTVDNPPADYGDRIRHQIKLNNTCPNLVLATDTLSLSPGGSVNGCVTKHIPKAVSHLEAIHPDSQKKLGLIVCAIDLVTLALKIAEAYTVAITLCLYHSDYKQDNLLVHIEPPSIGEPYLIDWDLCATKAFTCPIEPNEFSAPERRRDKVPSTEVTEAYSVTLLVWLTIKNASPYAFRGASTQELDRNENEGIFPHARGFKGEPIDQGIPFLKLHPKLQKHFTRTFQDSIKHPHRRPLISNLVEALQAQLKLMTDPPIIEPLKTESQVETKQPTQPWVWPFVFDFLIPAMMEVGPLVGLSLYFFTR